MTIQDHGRRGAVPSAGPDPRHAVLALSDERALAMRRIEAAWREGFARGRAAGYGEGSAAATTAMERHWQEIARPTARGGLSHSVIEERRWHLCCGPCRRSGHRAGCARCEDRTRATFSAPHSGDYRGGPVVWDSQEASAA